VSDIGYAAVPSLFVLDRRSGEQIAVDAISPLGRGTTLPGTLDHGPARARTKRLSIDIDPTPEGTRLQARAERVDLDVIAHLQPGHERLGVVVPGSERLFQYTVKDPARPAVGRVILDGSGIPDVEGTSWATLDHGRGRWPYAVSDPQAALAISRPSYRDMRCSSGFSTTGLPFRAYQWPKVFPGSLGSSHSVGLGGRGFHHCHQYRRCLQPGPYEPAPFPMRRPQMEVGSRTIWSSGGEGLGTRGSRTPPSSGPGLPAGTMSQPPWSHIQA
jgi:hypothetical protein